MKNLLRTVVAAFIMVFAISNVSAGENKQNCSFKVKYIPNMPNKPRIPARPNETLDAVYDANTDLLHLTFKKDLGDVTISIKSFGEDIMSEQYNINTGDTYSLSLADYASGEYEIVISTAGGQSYVGWLVK